MIATARHLLAVKGKPSQANLRRATSTAYYALFHCLARSCADLMIGGSGSTRSKHAWSQVYRNLEHGTAKNSCTDKVITQFPKGIEDFANAFVSMQIKRHDADYNPFSKFSKSIVAQDIETVDLVISDFNKTSVKDRRAFCSFVLFKKRT